jgi:photosystem II stability/assembly factor-like uncharacterized protein
MITKLQVVSSRLLMLLLLLSGFCFAQSRWELISPIGEVTDIVYAQNQYVATAGEYIITSRDGKKWVNHFIGSKLIAIAYGNGKFVAFASQSTRTEMFISSDGENWSEACVKDFTSSVIMFDIVYGSNMFIITGSGGTVLTSSDGVTWSEAVSPFSLISSQMHSISYGNGIFVAVGYNNADSLLISNDGISWNRYAQPTAALNSIAFGNGLFVATRFRGDSVFVSADGKNWTGSHVLLDMGLDNVSFSNGYFYIFNRYGLGKRSIDGINWEEELVLFGKAINAVTYGENGYIAAGKTIASSLNGKTWTEFGQTEKEGFLSITYGNKRFVTVADTLLAYSEDGLDWNSTEWCNPRCSYNSVAFGAGRFVMADVNGHIDTSSDGINWGRIALPFSDTTGAVVYYDKDRFIINITNKRTIATSVDGITWVVQPVQPQDLYARYCICYSVASGNGKTIGLEAETYSGQDGNPIRMVSIDNGVCTEISRLENGSITFGSGYFVLVNNAGKILTSTDGISWTKVFQNSLFKFNSVTYGNNQFVAVGSDGAIAISQADNIENVRKTTYRTTLQDKIRIVFSDNKINIFIPSELEPRGCRLHIMDIAGRTLFAKQLTGASRQISMPTSMCSSGVCFLSITDIRGKSQNTRLMITR